MVTDDIGFCVEALTNGELVAFPTETVFGLGARADSPRAVSKIFEIKNRPLDHPLIMHCSSIEIALAISPHVPEYARKLALAFWPGPMTLVFQRGVNDSICDEAVGGNDTVAIRVPSHRVARELLEPCNFFVAAPSANRYGQVSPTTAQHVQDEFKDDLIILNGEQSQCGLESTIISCLGPAPGILRVGAITKNEIQNIVGLKVYEADPKKQIEVSGNKKAHYAPSIPLFLVTQDDEVLKKHKYHPSKSAYIGGRNTELSFKLSKIVSNYEEYAHDLFDFFHEAQRANCEAIFAVPPENEGIGIAINDRLNKAAFEWADGRG